MSHVRAPGGFLGFTGDDPSDSPETEDDSSGVLRGIYSNFQNDAEAGEDIKSKTSAGGALPSREEQAAAALEAAAELVFRFREPLLTSDELLRLQRGGGDASAGPLPELGVVPLLVLCGLCSAVFVVAAASLWWRTGQLKAKSGSEEALSSDDLSGSTFASTSSADESVEKIPGDVGGHLQAAKSVAGEHATTVRSTSSSTTFFQIQQRIQEREKIVDEKKSYKVLHAGNVPKVLPATLGTVGTINAGNKMRAVKIRVC